MSNPALERALRETSGPNSTIRQNPAGSQLPNANTGVCLYLVYIFFRLVDQVLLVLLLLILLLQIQLLTRYVLDKGRVHQLVHLILQERIQVKL